MITPTYFYYFIPLILIWLIVIVVFTVKHNKKVKEYRSKRQLSLNQELTHRIALDNTFTSKLSLILTAFLAATTLLLTIISINNQVEFSERQLSIIKDTSIPNWPTLEIALGPWTRGDRLEFSKSDLIPNHNGQTGEFGVIIINMGKVNSGIISLDTSTSSNDNIFFYTTEENRKILSDGIEPQGAIRFEVTVKQKGCDHITLEGCDEETLTTGINKLNLTFSCEFCRERYVTLPISICIWEKSSSECE